MSFYVQYLLYGCPCHIVLYILLLSFYVSIAVLVTDFYLNYTCLTMSLRLSLSQIIICTTIVFLCLYWCPCHRLLSELHLSYYVSKAVLVTEYFMYYYCHSSYLRLTLSKSIICTTIVILHI